MHRRNRAVTFPLVFPSIRQPRHVTSTLFCPTQRASQQRMEQYGTDRLELTIQAGTASNIQRYFGLTYGPGGATPTPTPTPTPSPTGTPSATPTPTPGSSCPSPTPGLPWTYSHGAPNKILTLSEVANAGREP